MTDDVALPTPAPIAETPPTDSVAAPPPPPSHDASDANDANDANDAPRSPPRRPVWPFLGPTLYVFGGAMWAYAAMGELATTYVPPLHMFVVGEGVAVLFVLATTAATWWLSIRASLAQVPARSAARAIARGGGVAVSSFVLWLFVVFVTTAFGRSTHSNLDGKITVFLLLAGAAAALVGRRLTALDLTGTPSRETSIARAAWIGAASITLVALVAVLAD